jgi:hypothetical protein
MSRLPFSQLYDSLEESDKTLFTEIIGPLVEKVGDHFKLGEYVDYAAKAVSSGISIKDWYDSIINPARRKSVGEGRKERQVDLLSPPPGLPEDYSMGFYNKPSQENTALIEVRGYSNVRYNGETTLIKHTSQFVSKEADWFFGLDRSSVLTGAGAGASAGGDGATGAASGVVCEGADCFFIFPGAGGTASGREVFEHKGSD